MKTPQRNFTVEIKSSRRRPKLQPKSIWGDTDFKALAREAEAAHGVKNNVAVAVPAQSAPAHVVAPVCASNISLSRVDEPQAPSPETEALSVSLESHSVQVTEHLPDQIAPVKRVAKRPKRIKQASNSTEQSERLILEQTFPSHDDIATLEDENHKLRAALTLRLTHENALLRKMLERFVSA